LTPIELCMITTLLSRVLLVHPLKSPISPSLCSRSFSRSLRSLNDGGLTGSGKLFVDAVLEEAEEHANNNSSQRKSHLQFLENQHANWDGEERMEDAVLRMLVDKYKPLRGGTIRTAEEKLKQTPPSVRLETTSVAEARQSDWANHTILPAIEGHKPWLTTYKVPSHAATSIRTGRFPPPASTRSSGASSVDDRTRRKEIELKKREEVVGRLTKAKESTLDYRLGINRADAPKRIRPNPISLRGWTSLIEDKIEVCRSLDIPLT
jgi:hypothetical protein